MKTFSTLYTNIIELEKFIDDNHVPREQKSLVRIITSNLTRNKSLELASSMKNMLPNCDVIGMTSSFSVIFDSQIVDNSTLIIIECYESLELHCQIIEYENKTYKDVAKDIHEKFKDEINDNVTINLLITPAFVEINELVLDFNTYSPMVNIAGAVVGIMPHNDDAGFIFTDTQIIPNANLAFCLKGKSSHHYIGSSFSYEAEENTAEYTITEVERNIIKKVDGRDAAEWLYEYLQLSDRSIKFDPLFLARFPILITYDNSCRFLEFDHDTQEVIIHENTSLPVNTKIQKACITPLSTYKYTYENLLSMLQCPMESIFVYVCLFRKIFLPNSIAWEFASLKDYKVCGMIAMGEVVYLNGQNQYHHGSSIFTSISETESYIIPKLDLLKDTSLIAEDIKALTNSDNSEYEEYERITYDNYQKILNEKYKEFEDQNYYLDNDLKLPNMIKYRCDKQSTPYDKLCLIMIETADSIISFLGKKIYNEIVMQVIVLIDKKYTNEFHQYGIKAYSFNYKSIFLVAPDSMDMEKFVELCKYIHSEVEQIVNVKYEVTLINKFTLIENKKHMIEKAIKYSFDNSNSIDTFSIVPSDIGKTQDNTTDISVVNMLKWAIDNNGIVPFYQGLYNNETKTIDKYESLMRLQDKDGVIHSPFKFLELSKKYHFYNKISKMMIEQVFSDFNDRPEKISVNISLRDIKHNEFREWFVTELENFNNPSRVTIELLESDDFKGDDIFFDFLNRVQDLGCKIAIDDFGSGYSTFMTILDIEPDYIKIDGSIIKKIATDEKFAVLLETLAIFAKKVNCKTVAEFVEDETIQNVLEDNDITYSQGYFFAKPSPINEI